MNRYSIHAETTDGTLQPPSSWVNNKTAAIRIITGLSKMYSLDVTRYLVCDSDGQTVAVKEVKQ